MIHERIAYIGVPEGTKRKLDRLRLHLNKQLGIELNHRSELVRLILLEGIADLERECASLRGALVLKYRKERRH